MTAKGGIFMQFRMLIPSLGRCNTHRARPGKKFYHSAVSLLNLCHEAFVHSDASGPSALGLGAGCWQACRSSQEYQKVKPGLKFPWVLAHVPVRSCHRVLKDKYGEFSPPAYHGDSSLNVWCNWTIWAGSRKHIIIYIQGFITEEGCNKNEDKILFEGISSLVENSVIYACWKKETHVFATFAQGVHVVLLKRYLPNCRETQFKGKYYIFQDWESEYSSKDYVISETPAPKLLKQGSISQTGWAKDLRHVLGFTTTRSTMSLGETRVLRGELLQGRESTLGSMAAGSRAELVTSEGARTLFLETKAPCVESELQGLRGCKEVQGGRKPVVMLPTAVQGLQRQNLSVRGDITLGFDYMQRLSSVLLETPSLSALHVVEPLLPRTGVGLEKRQPVLHPTLEPKDLEDLQFAIKPTQTNQLDLAADSQSSSLRRRESKESTDTTMYQGLDTVNLEKDERHPQLSILADSTVSGDADGLAKGLMPSLSSPYEVVNREHSHLLPRGSQSYRSSFGDLSVTQPELGTTVLQHTKLVSISPLESLRGAVKRETVLHPTALWDILQEYPPLHDQSSHGLQSAPTDPGSLSKNAQAHDCPEAEKTPVSSLGVKICHHQSDRAAQQRLITPPLPTGLKHLPIATSTPGRETTSTLVVSGSEPVPADFGSTGFTSEARLPLEVGSMSKAVLSPPAALDFNAISLSQRAGISLSSPGEKEIVSPSPPPHLSVASKLSTDGSPGMPKVVLGETGGQQGETSASVDLVARGPSPASITVTRPGVGLPRPEDNMSSGSVVAPVFLPSTSTRGVRREELKVPVQHQDTAIRDELASLSILGEFKMQKAFETLQEGAEEQKNSSSSTASEHTGPSVALWGEGQKLQEPSGDPVSRNSRMPGGQQQNHAEQGLPWAVEYFPISSCHLIFQDGSGIFYLPLHADIKTNIWCNWTIWAGPQKHIVIYIQGFQASQGCGKNEDKIIFQGVSSSVETKVVYACHSQGTLIFATQATAVHVLFLSGSASQGNEYGHFKGQYYVFRDPETADSSNDTRAPQEPVKELSKKETWRKLVTKSSLPMLKASPGPSTAPAGSRIHPKLVNPDEDDLYPPSLMDNAQSGGNLSKLNLSEHGQLQDETNLERSLKDGGTQDRKTEDDVLVKPTLAGQDAGHEAEPSVLEVAKQGIDLASGLVTIVPHHPVDVSSSEVPSSNVGNSAKSLSLEQASDSLSEEVVADAHHTQIPVLEEPQLNANMKPLYPFPGLTAGDKMSLGERNKFFDLVSAPASLENDTALQSQHHPGDVLFEVTIEIKPKDWIPRCGSELQKGLLESMKNHIQENLKLSANRVSEIKLKEIKRTSDANLLVTFWLHLKPEERNVSLLLHSQLKELLGSPIGVEKLQLVSLLVEDVNECSAGVSLCGEEAECFNGVGTYLCRCKKDYEDHSPTKTGTLCIRVPQTGISFFLLHGDILVGAAMVAGLATLVAAGALCWSAKCGRHHRRNQSPEEPQG
ncbi:uncharacterized protein [Heliangelus exortis]|uniref:uncharacterized protein n=1 Tax=Heliangelus exortis TaxID=472823 RepID=UPI003A8DB5A7